MSSYAFYKVPFEGKVEKVYELIKSRDWDASIKMSENGILFMKISVDSEDEVSFYQNMIFDENTKSKFGNFETISESDYETALNIEIPTSGEKEEKKENIDKEKNKNTENFQKKMEEENMNSLLTKVHNSFL